MRTEHVRLLLLTLVLTACASSTHNLDTQGRSFRGGGFSTQEIAPGFFRLYARSNNVTLGVGATGGAQKTWHNMATRLCRRNGYRELDVTENTSELIPTAPGFAPVGYATKAGYVICNSAGLSDGAVRALLQEKLEPEQPARTTETPPNRSGPVKIFVTQPPGGLPDVLARIVSQQLKDGSFVTNGADSAQVVSSIRGDVLLFTGDADPGFPLVAIGRIDFTGSRGLVTAYVFGAPGTTPDRWYGVLERAVAYHNKLGPTNFVAGAASLRQSPTPPEPAKPQAP
jgi:hypothetical protein